MAEIFRVYKQKNYTVMSNHHLQNQNLSLKAMGLLSKLLSLPDDWNISIRGMAKICKDGYDSIRTAFQELIAEGYVIRKTLRDTCGRLSGVAYIVREHPSVMVPDTFLSDKKSREEIVPAHIEEPDNEEKDAEEEELLENRGFEPYEENPTKVNAIIEEPYRENPITVNAIKEEPYRENPITVNAIKEEPYGENPTTENPTTGNPTTGNPTTEKPTTGNPCGLNTNINNNTKIINTKKQNIKELNNTPPPEMGTTEERVKEQIGYAELLTDNDKRVLDTIVLLLVRYQSGIGQYAYIEDKKVAARDIQKQFQKLGGKDIEKVLCSAVNTKIKNMQSYLISALYRTVQRGAGENNRPPNTDKNRFNNFHQREYNYEELEKQLLL